MNEKLLNYVNKSTHDTFTTNELRSCGFRGEDINALVANGILSKWCQGIYLKSGELPDTLYLYQTKYPKGIYSNETALYLHGLIDRNPIRYTMTFPKGYNSPSIKELPINIKRDLNKNYEIGVCELNSFSGKKVRVYDIERSLCDLLRDNSSDLDLLKSAFKQYVNSDDVNVNKLLGYAKQLRVSAKVNQYLEVLL